MLQEPDKSYATDSVDMNVHQSFVQAFPEKAGSNAPEGIHQDGSDYIVSALVVDRGNIVGEISKIYGPDKKM